MARQESGHVLSRDGETARTQILTAARSVISRCGFAKTTMEDIAREAGISRPTVYRYFKDRTDLKSALIDWRARKLLDGTRQLLQDRKSADTPFEEYLLVGLVHVLTTARRDTILREFLTPGSQQLESWLKAFDLAVSLTCSLWGPVFDEATERGEMRADLERSELYIWLTLVQFSLFNRMESVGPGDPVHSQMLRTYVLPILVAPAPKRYVGNSHRPNARPVPATAQIRP